MCVRGVRWLYCYVYDHSPDYLCAVGRSLCCFPWCSILVAYFCVCDCTVCVSVHIYVLMLLIAC